VSEETNLFAQQEANRRRSTYLIVGFILFFMWVGFGGDIALYLLTSEAPPGAYHHVVPFIGLMTTLGAGVICWYSWRYGAEKILWSTRAGHTGAETVGERRRGNGHRVRYSPSQDLDRPR
jgi:hypothetical protein